jgi:hypothetical protein
MATPSLRFKKLFVGYAPVDRATILNNLSTWVTTVNTDPKIQQFSGFLQQLQGYVAIPKKEFETHHVWLLANALNDSVAFQEVVKAKLGVPAKNIDAVIEKKESGVRKTIPKKTREAVWKRDCGDRTSGNCFCCSEEVTVLGSWHAGHIVAQCNGGPDTVENLRVVCVACNLAMGTEDMGAFKTRCYPPKAGHPSASVMSLDTLSHILKNRR